jgi:hypothetical protein
MISVKLFRMFSERTELSQRVLIITLPAVYTMRIIRDMVKSEIM